MKARLAIVCLIVAVFTVGAVGCANSSSTDAKQGERTEAMIAEADRQVGMPGITNFTERKFVKYLYELRDQDGFSTYTYIVDFNGKLHFVCESVGYGIPWSAQFVNPERPHRMYRGNEYGITLPQPEPNGLFTPDGLAATWILCVDGEGGVRPIYSEPELLVSPFRLKAADSYVIEDGT